MFTLYAEMSKHTIYGGFFFLFAPTTIITSKYYNLILSNKKITKADETI